MRAFPNVNYRSLVHEYDGIKLALDFRNQTTWPLQVQGRDQVKDFLAASEQGFNGFKTLQEWAANEDDLHETFDSFTDYYKATLKSYLPFF